MSPTTQADVNAWRGRFRILRGWRIRLGSPRGTQYRAQVTTHPTKRAAYIHPWDPATAEPDDFLLHELLHVSLEALRRTPKRQIREAEELLVQDLCRVAFAPGRPPQEGGQA